MPPPSEKVILRLAEALNAEKDELMLISSQGMVIRMPVEPIRVISRNTQGVRLISLDKNDTVVGVARVVSEGE